MGKYSWLRVAVKLAAVAAVGIALAGCAQNSATETTASNAAPIPGARNEPPPEAKAAQAKAEAAMRSRVEAQGKLYSEQSSTGKPK